MAATNKNRLLFIAACIGMLLFGITLITLGSVAEELRLKFHLDALQSGKLFLILPVGILIGSFLFGPYCDRKGYKIALIISCACIAVGLTGIAYVPSLNILRLCIIVFGIGGGAINGSTNAIVSEISTEGKTANLSLLGVFFGIGALGMPFVIAACSGMISYQSVVFFVALVTVAAAIFFSSLTFPAPKQSGGFQFFKTAGLYRDGLLLCIAFFLFCQSGFEAIINNWTTAFLLTSWKASHRDTLFILSLFVASMAVMRLMTGTLFRKVTISIMLYWSLGLLFAGIAVLAVTASLAITVCGLILLGAGLAGGFPIMLGFVGSRYQSITATAFSFVLVIALTGNVAINYLMGYIAFKYGVQHLLTVAALLSSVMTALSILIVKRMRNDLLNKN